ncbi:MAG: hypothetical protein C5B50_20990 [Verrucomicrobia bacterium]|nr:MAG: hypothetical protein C5B50_20990 [Verrucomicrobiota bacterium]
MSESFWEVSKSQTVGRLALIAATAMFWRCSHAQVTVTVGPNVNITKSSANNVEECIAINPVNPANLFASDTWAGAHRYSLDGGSTWHNSNISALPGSIGDVAATFDTFGNLFLTKFGPSESIQVDLSTDGGASFSLLYQTTATGNDQPKVATGPSSVAGQKCVWITYTDPNNFIAVQGATVTGLGAVGSFSASQTTSVIGDFGDVAVGPNGQVLVSFQDPLSGVGPDTINVNLDADGLGAATFGSVISASDTQVGGFTDIPAQPQRSIDAEAKLAWDRTGGSHNGRVYLSYTDRPSTSSDDTDIYVRYSDNNGSTWSSPVRVNDDPVGNGKSQFLPRIALDQTTGYIAVSFYDCRNSDNNDTAEYWASVSTDGGQTFMPNVKVSAGISSALVMAVANTYFDFGDYSGLTYHAGTFYPCWADNSNSTGDNPAGAGSNLDLYTARVTVMPPVVMLNPRRISNTFHVSVRTVAMKNYYLQSTPSVRNPVWSSVTSVPGDGTVKELVDSSATSPQAFYRVKAQ